MQQRQRNNQRQNLNHENLQTTTNLNSLHCKLQEEAEKIRKWQTSSEIELKQKMARLKESEQMINQQRNQILEMQIENETLASQLQNEQLNQDKINIKLKSSRELFIALKTHSEYLQTSVARGEEDKDSLRLIAADNLKHIQKLRKELREMAEANEVRVTELQALIKNKELAIEDVKFKSAEEIGKARKTNQSIDKEIVICKGMIDNLSGQLISKKNSMEELESKIASLEEELLTQLDISRDSEVGIAELRAVLEDTKLSYDAAQVENVSIKEDNANLNSSYTEFKTEADKKIDELQGELGELTDGLTTLSTQYNEILSSHDRIESENASLKESVSQLVKCVEELQLKQEQNEQELTQVTDMYNESKLKEDQLQKFLLEKEGSVSELLESNVQLESDLREAAESLEKLQLKETDYVSQIQELTLSQTKQSEELSVLDEKVAGHSVVLKSKEAAILMQQQDHEKQTQSLKDVCDQFEMKYVEINKVLTEKDCCIGELEKVKEELINDVDSLKTKLCLLESNHASLNDQVGELKCNVNESYSLLEKSKKANEAQKKMIDSTKKELKDNKKVLNTSESYTKKMLKENESLKNQQDVFQSKLKESEEHIANSTITLKNLESRLKECEKVIEGKIALVSDLNERITSLELELEEARTVISSKEEGSSKMSDKLLSQLETAKKAVKEKEAAVKELRKEISSLKKEVKDKDSSSSFVDAKLDSLQENITQVDNLLQQERAINKENTAQISLLIKEKADLAAEKLSLAKTIELKTGDVAALAEEINSLHNKLSDFERSGSVSEDVKAMRSELDNLRSEKSDLISSRTLLEDELQNNCIYIKALEAKEKEFAGDIKNMKKSNVELEKQITTLNESSKSLNKELKSSKDAFTQLKKVTAENNLLVKKLKDQDSKLDDLQSNLQKVKNGFLLSEENYKTTISNLKDELKSMRKEKVAMILSKADTEMTTPLSSSPAHRESCMSPKTPTRPRSQPASPKTPSNNPSKKRRVAFGKSPTWKPDPFDEDENVVSSSTSRTPHQFVQTVYSGKSPKSPGRLKLKVPGSKSNNVVDLLNQYPKSDQKRGVKLPQAKLPDAYLKRKEQKQQDKKKIKVEACSWFDSDSAFGFDDM